MNNRPKKEGPKRDSEAGLSRKKHPRNEFADNEKPKRKRIDKGSSKPKPWERMNQEKADGKPDKQGFEKKRTSSVGDAGFSKSYGEKNKDFNKSERGKQPQRGKSQRFDKETRFDKSNSDKSARYGKSDGFSKQNSGKFARNERSDSENSGRFNKSSRFDKTSGEKSARFGQSDSEKSGRFNKSSRFDKTSGEKPARFDQSDSEKSGRFNKTSRFDKKSGDKPARFDQSDSEKSGRFNKTFGNEKSGTRRSSGYGNSTRFEKSEQGGGRNVKTNEKKSFNSRIEDSEEGGLIRLNRYISNSGICSRREADELIEAGAVSVNGKIITELGYKVRPGDKVNYGGETLNREKKVYLLLNKPKDYITTTDDPEKRKTVMELLKGACKERIYPVGRLDRATTGLLLFTNDGELAKRLTHPSHGAKKLYHVHLNNPLKKGDFEKIEEGLELEDGPIKVDQIVYAGDTGDKRELGVEIHSGKNRIVRRIFESLGYEVVKLDRVIFAGLTKKDLSRGRWRFLSEKEISMLNMIKK